MYQTNFKDAEIVTLYKGKENRTDCSSYRGISLLSTTGKILAKVMQSRLATNIIDKVVSESHCGFRSNRGTVDIIFSAGQLQEKCIEQNIGLYAAFIDLTKAFDMVQRDALEHPCKARLSI